MTHSMRFQEALALALQWLGYRGHTAGEVARRLVSKGADEATAAAVVNYLQEKGYLDDAAYAVRWLEGHVQKGWGRYRLLAGLLQKGLPRHQVDELLERHLPYEREVEQAVEIARQRWQKAGGAGPQAWRALATALRCRGYSSEILSAVRERLEAEGLAALDKVGKRE